MDAKFPSNLKGDAAERRTGPPAVRAVDSAVLLGDRREMTIRHGADEYRLRLTRQNKLILTK